MTEHLWLTRGIQEGCLSVELAAKIMRIIDNPDLLDHLEMEIKMLKDSIINKLPKDD